MREPAAQHVVRVLIDLGVVCIVARVVDAIRPISVNYSVTFPLQFGNAVFKRAAVLCVCMCVGLYVCK